LLRHDCNQGLGSSVELRPQVFERHMRIPGQGMGTSSTATRRP
jgi:hypothetical protein